MDEFQTLHNIVHLSLNLKDDGAVSYPAVRADQKEQVRITGYGDTPRRWDGRRLKDNH